MRYLFLEKDAVALRERLAEIEKRRLDLAGDAATNVGQAAESWHDNAGFEVALREQMDLAKRLSELREIVGRMEVVEPSKDTKRVSVGAKITLREIETGKETDYLVSSYRVLDKKVGSEVSYDAPVVKPFIGRKVRTRKTVEAPTGKTKYELVGIQPGGIG